MTDQDALADYRIRRKPERRKRTGARFVWRDQGRDRRSDARAGSHGAVGLHRRQRASAGIPVEGSPDD